MIKELCDYYDQLKESNVDIPEFGYSAEKINMCIILDKNGKLVQFKELFDTYKIWNKAKGTSEDKKVSRRMNVPVSPLSSRSNNVLPNFTWDNASYIIGIGDNKMVEKKQAFKDVINTAYIATGDEGLLAIKIFLEKYVCNIEIAGDKKLETANIVFQLEDDIGLARYVYERPLVKKYWHEYLIKEVEKEQTGICLITGEENFISRLHPKIKGVSDTNTTGGSLISFQQESSCSHGNEQGFNAPINVYSAFKYTAVLNYMLSRKSKHKIHFGDTTVLFWSGKENDIETFLPHIINPSSFGYDHNDGYDERLEIFLKRVKRGIVPDNFESDVPFYILTLKGNIARIAVKSWLITDIGEMYDNLVKHFDDINIISTGKYDSDCPSIRTLLKELTRTGEYKKILSKDIGNMLNSVLLNMKYPQTFLMNILNRIHREQKITYNKASLLKGILNRNHKMELVMKLDETRTDQMYLIGRLFAVMEKIQGLSHYYNKKVIKKTIVDRHFSSASVRPQITFLALRKLMISHINMIKNTGHAGTALYYDKMIQDLECKIGDYPKQITIEEQCLFYTGYYQQKQDFWEKIKEHNNQSEDNKESNNK